MKKFITTVRNIFSIEDLRVRIFNTIGFLIIFRLGSFIVLPGVDASKLGEAPEGIFGLIDTFLGGAFSNASILSRNYALHLCFHRVAVVDCRRTLFSENAEGWGVREKANQSNHPRTDHCHHYCSRYRIRHCDYPSHWSSND